MSDIRRQNLGVVVVLAAGMLSVGAQPLPAQQDRVAEAAPILRQLRSGDPEQHREAVAAIREIAAQSPSRAMAHLRSNFKEPMFEAGLHAEAEQIALELILRSPTNQRIVAMQAVRLEALVAAERYDEALPVAKGYYNIVELASTDVAIEWIERVLRNTLAKDDPEIVTRFRRQQAAWGASPEGADPSAQDLGENVLNLIKVDPAPFEAALAAVPEEDRLANHTARGNLLLLMDRPAEAREAFERALDRAQRADSMRGAIENLARAIRAEHGAVGPANAYILSLRD